MKAMWKKISKKYRYSTILLRELVRTDFKVKYQDSMLGYLWSVLKPLFMFTILYVIFIKVLRVGANIENWAVALLTGVMLWQFFTDITNSTLRAVVGKGSLLRKIKFPRYIIIVSSSISALITLGINSLVVILFATLNGVSLTWNVLFIIPLVIQLLVFALGVGFFLSAAYVRFRDIQYIWDVVSQALFYGSAIIFPVSLIANISGSLGNILVNIALANPVAQIIQDVRHLTINDKIPSLATVNNGEIIYYLIPLTITLVTFVFGAWYFRKHSPYFAEDI